MRTIKTYSEEILKKYEEKGVLLEPTRTDIKDQCIVRFLEGNHVKDEAFLRLFFKVNREDDLLKTIESTDPEKFRTVQNFLLRNTGSTSRKNLNLIAWLIDFQPRPYNLYRMQEIQKKIATTAIDEPRASIKEYVSKTDTFAQKKDSYSNKRTWISASFISLCSLLLYGMSQFSIQKEKGAKEKIITENTSRSCMAWNGDVYEIIDCIYNLHPQYRTKVIVHNEPIQKNLRRAEVSIKTRFFAADNETPLIWFYKIRSNTYEYFTAKGIHPVYGDSLHKITQYHIDHYIPKYKNEEKSFLKED